MGQYNVWYADQPYNAAFRRKVWNYIEHRRPPGTRRKSARKGGQRRQPDTAKRLDIENRAMRAAERYYSLQLGYKVTPVHRENLGWDLKAIGHGQELKIEVKGLSGHDVVTELTPREYAKMKEYADSYHLFVLTQALKGKRAIRYVFEYDEDLHIWRDDTSGKQLHFERLIAARVSA